MSDFTAKTRSRTPRLLGCSLAGVALSCLMWALPAAAQNDERPEVHAEFTFGAFPYVPDAVAQFESEQARMIVGAFDRGWSIEKFVDETDSDEIEVLMLVDDLENANLVRGLNDFDMRPGLLLVRESEARELSTHIDQDAAELVRIIEEHWDEVETFASALESGQDLPPGQMFYTAIVGGLLTGGLIDALMEDQTLVPGPPRRGRRGEGYYAWLVEGPVEEPAVKRESARVGRYTVVSVGTEPEDNLRIQIEQLRGQGPVFESRDAQQWRVFTSLFSRDYLLPYLISRRSDFLELHLQVRSARYTAFGEFAAWYYQKLVDRVVEALDASGRIVAPESTYQFAIRTGR